MLNGSDTVCSRPTTDRSRPVPIRWRTTGRGGLGDQLVAEWQRLRHSRPAIDRARALAVTDEHFADLDELLQLAGFGMAPSPASDAVLARLVDRAADDELAARILLQRILPGLLALAAGELRRSGCATALGELVGEAWVAIRSYGRGRPATAIPARLLNDARHRAFTGPRRRRRLVVAPSDLQQRAAPEQQHPFAELVALLAEAHDTGLDSDLLATARLLLGHESVNAAAASAGVTARSLRTHRRALVGRLRTLLTDDPAEALDARPVEHRRRQVARRPALTAA